MLWLIPNFLKIYLGRMWRPASKILILLLPFFLFLNISVPINSPRMLKSPENGCGPLSKGTSPQEVIRFHVKAHSDRPEDQRIKNELAKMLIDVYGPSWGKCKNSSELKIMLGKSVNILEEKAQHFLLDEGIQHRVQATLEKRFFPARSYAGYFYPAGEYDALYVTIGDGAGENWWCVLFPPLCFNIFPMKTNNERVREPETRGSLVVTEEGSENRSGKKWCFWLVEFFRGNT